LSTLTPNFSLIKPELTDQVSQTITDTGTNMDTIDTNMQLYANHLVSTSAHASQYITYTGDVSGQTEVQGALNNLQTQLDAAIIGSGTSPAEVVAARNSIRSEVNALLNDRLNKIEMNQGQITSKSSSTALVASERGVILVDTSGGDVTLDLPDATGSLMMIYTIKKTTSDSNVVIVDPNASQTIDGSTTHTVSNQWDSIRIVNDGSNWIILSEKDDDLDLSALILTATNSAIRTDTTDGSDNKNIYINGGGGEGTSRGAQIRITGNEYASNAGSLILNAGVVATGDIDFITNAGQLFRLAYNGDIQFPTLTANRAVSIDGSNNLVVSTVTDTELDYLSGVSSALQTQLNNKQPLDADLTALAALSSTGMMARTAANTYLMRTITGTANQIELANGDGVSDNPTISLPNVIYQGTSGKLGRDADNLIDWTTDNEFKLRLNATDEIFTINATGDARLGGAGLETWNATWTALEINDATISNNTSQVMALCSNGYYDTSPSWKYKSTGFALKYMQNSNEHIFETAPSGSADAAISFTTRMTINTTGVQIPIITASRAVVTDASNYLTASATTSTQIGYLSNVTSDVQNQIDSKQDVTTSLTNFLALGSAGIVAKTGASTYALRTVTGTANQIEVADGDGSSGNPTISLPNEVFLGALGKLGRDGDNYLGFTVDNEISFYINAAAKLKLDATGLATSGTDFLLYTNTSDASDNQSIWLCGGGINTEDRGAYIVAYGNEYGSSLDGHLVYSTGNAANAKQTFNIGATPVMELENDLDARFYGQVGVGRSPTGSYELELYTASGGCLQLIKSAASGTVASLYLDGYKTTDQEASSIYFLNNGNNIAKIEADRDTADNRGALIFSTSQGGSIPAAMKIDSSQITYIGDAGTTNYTQFVADGIQTMVGTARVKKTIYFSVGEMSNTATAGADKNNTYFKTKEVDAGEGAYASLQVPKDWDSSTDLTISVDWICDEAYATNNAELNWQALWGAVPNDGTEDIDVPTHSGTITSGDVNLPTGANSLSTSQIGTIAAASLSADDSIGLEITRIALVGGTNPGQKPRMVAVRVEYTANKLGEAL